MGNLRPVLLITIAMLGYMLWIEWQKDYGPATQRSSSPVVQPATQSGTQSGTQASDLEFPEFSPNARTTPVDAGDLPSAEQDLPGSAPQEQVSAPAVMQADKETISVTTDVLDVKIDPVGGTVVSARLLDYPVDHDEPDRKFDMFTPYGDNLFIAQSGLLSHQGAPNHGSEYQSERNDYALARGADELRVPLTWSSPEGINVTKTFVFKEGS
jgi:YidC/Oxa1 family membrane protein insertase